MTTNDPITANELARFIGPDLPQLHDIPVMVELWETDGSKQLLPVRRALLEYGFGFVTVQLVLVVITPTQTDRSTHDYRNEGR